MKKSFIFLFGAIFLITIVLFFIKVGSRNNIERLEYTDGNYVIGKDMPAGYYILENLGTDSTTFVNNEQVASVLYYEKGDKSTSIYGTAASTFLYFTVADGDSIEIKGGVAYPVSSELREKVVEKYMNTTGMFKVGEDIEAGKYLLKYDSSTDKGIMKEGYVLVVDKLRDRSGGFDEGETSKIIKDSVVIEVNDGEYMEVTNATWEKL